MSIRKSDVTQEDILRDKILRNIEECDDKSIKVVLLMMLEVLDAIGRKIDVVMRDEEALRETVLNGDAATHAEDHREWREFRKEWAEVKPVFEALKDNHPFGGYCPWAAAKMDEEKAAAESRRKVREGWLVHVAWALTTVIAVAVYNYYFGPR